MRTLVLLLLIPFFAGCVSHPGGIIAVATHEPAAAASSYAETAFPPPEIQGESRLIGRVLDDSQVPIANATAKVLELRLLTRSHADGRFVFDRLQRGTYTLLVNAPGYNPEAKQLSLEQDQVEVHFSMSRAPVEESWADVRPWTLMHHYNILSWGDPPFYFSYNASQPPTHMLLEIAGHHTLSNPQGDKEASFFGAKSNQNYNAPGRPLPVRMVVNVTRVDGQSTTEFSGGTMCEASWACYEERRDVWLSTFYNMDIPEGYTALQP